MHVTMLTRRRVKKGLCLGLGCYALFLLFSLTTWHRGQSDDTDLRPERLGRAALSDHHVENSDEDVDDHDSQDGQVMLPETLDRVLQQHPGAPAARKKLSKPESRHVNVIVEDALPGTFIKHASPPEGSSEFKDLRPKVVDEDIHPLDRLKATKRHQLDRIKAARRGGESQSMGIARQNALAPREPLPREEDMRVEDSAPLDGHSQENAQSEGVWLAPDGRADDLVQTKTLNPVRADQPGQGHPVALPAKTDSLRTAAMLNISVSNTTAKFKELADVTIYSAFYDDRLSVPLVRMLAVGPISRRPSATSLWCVFATESSEPVQVSFHQTADCRRMKKYCFYMLHCEVPDGVQYSPARASNTLLVVVGKREDNFLSQSGERARLDVIVNRKPSTDHAASSSRSDRSPLFSVCVPPLFGKLNVLHFVEFVELNRLLGASYFTFYTFRVSREISRVLTFYEEAGVARVLPWDLPAPNDVWYRGRGLALGDCLFRNMHLFHYVAFHDLDEFVVPRKVSSWRGLLDTVHAQSENLDTIAAVYELLPVMFYSARTEAKLRAGALLSEASKFLTLRNTLRGSVSSANFSKLLVRPDRVLELDEHHVVQPISELYVSYQVDPHTASVHHYRQLTCSPSPEGSAVENCGQLSEDRTVWRYKGLLVERTKTVLQRLNRLGASLT